MISVEILRRYSYRVRLKHVLWTFIVLFTLDFFGVFSHLFERNYYENFHYPLEGDIAKWARQIRMGQKPDIAPINVHNYSLIYDSKQKCLTTENTFLQPKLVFIVKSARSNFINRQAIRQSWGFEKRFSDVIIRTVFLIGKASDTQANADLQKTIDIESDNFKDIVFGDFIDSYFNNTIKTTMGMRWAIEFCPRSKFYMFVDDDFYISTKNVLRFIRNPINYPEYIEEADETLRRLARRLSSTNNTLDEITNKRNKKRSKRDLMNMELPNNVKLFAGFMFSSSPHRHKSSKWHVSLAEWPWHMWPPYITAGAFILSQEALREMYYTSMFTKHFRFDDIFLAIVAGKANIEPLHSEEFHFHKATYYGPHSYRYVVASHGYSNPEEMVKVWSECRSAGHV